MPPGSHAALRCDLQTLFEAGSAGGASDRELLERFANRRDASAEAAFESLVRRHGPMVLRVCRNALADPNDAHDAFQATFLMLVRRYVAIRHLESLGGWLFGVACRVAARARVETARRRAVERRAASHLLEAIDPAADGRSDHDELGPIVQEEVNRLSDNYRAVVVLCYWQGLTHEQAAIRLGCPLGTVRSRLARARDVLRRRLSRRGLGPLAGAVASRLDLATAHMLTPIQICESSIGSTVEACARVASGLAVSDVTTGPVAALVQTTLWGIAMTKLRTAVIGLVLLGVGAWGITLASPQTGLSGPRSDRTTSVPVDTRKSQPAITTLETYIVEPPDALLVEVLEALPGRPISGERLVRPDGKISLGYYGDVYVAGLSIPEIKAKIIEHLRKFINDETLGLIERDKNNKLVVDPTTSQPRFTDPKDSNRVFVDVTLYNSKVYYIQGAVVEQSRLPVTGHETVLDAIYFAGGLTPAADHARVVLYRPRTNGQGPPLAMPVNIDQVLMGDDMSTNYQIRPGDRLVIPRRSSDAPDAVPVDAEAPSVTAPKPQSGPRQIHRQPDGISERRRDSAAPPSSGAAEKATLFSLDRRLREVEHKLDQILEALRSQPR
jgi:RNA polymerase sigma factor (sigma-70 family)